LLYSQFAGKKAVRILIDHQPPESSGTSASSFHESANLDFLRSIAVLLVFGTHWYGLQFNSAYKWTLVWKLSQLGVLIFFVHTCLVLMWSLERAHLSGWSLFKSFYIRRIFRIYPLVIVCVLLAYCFDLRWNPINLWQNLTLTQYFFKSEFPPILPTLWTLPLEVEMYAFIPLLFLWFRSRSLKWLLALWTVSVFGAFIQPALGAKFTIMYYTPCFLGGVIAWKLARERVKKNFPGWVWPAAIAAVSIIWIASTEKYGALSVAVFGLGLGLVIPMFREIAWDSLKTVSRIVARYSYGIYLAHFPIMLWVMGNPQYPLFKKIPDIPHLTHYVRSVHLFLVVVLTAFASLMLYHLIENPCIQLGKKLAEWITTPAKNPPTSAILEEEQI
jgi:peptidoglycan/LPS O-acetylase OafA/YrhL